MLIGIILGTAVQNTGLLPKKWEPYLKKFEPPLLWGIMFLGAGFSVKIAAELPPSLIVIFTTMGVGYIFGEQAGQGLPSSSSPATCS